MMWGRIAALVLTSVLLAACQPAAPLRIVTEGEIVAEYTFAETGTFEEGGYNDATLRIRDGVYRIDVRQGNGALWWGQWGETLGDVVVQVEATQATERPETAYGVMCRVRGAVGQPLADEATPEATEVVADDATPEATEAVADDATPEATEASNAVADEPTAEATAEGAATDESASEAAAEATVEPVFGGGDGYLFLVQGTGAYGIFIARERSLTPLVDWTTSAVVNQGRASNTLRATCVGDYLALSINGQQVAQVLDGTYRQGQVGLVASAANRLGVTVTFDNLSAIAATGS